MFLSLDFVYVPTADVDTAAARYVAVLGARLEWKVRGMATVVACLRVSEDGPAVLLSGHLAGANPILVYRVADYRDALRRLRDEGVGDVTELEIPHGPCASFRAPGGQRMAVYELVRPGVERHFAGRVDEPDLD
jgi:catechol 2,3-dioxygenase-like lactoylglutathione lyase family enzyme